MINKTKNQKNLLLFILLLDIPFIAICQRQTWSVYDRAALLGYMANPGFELRPDHPETAKMLEWTFYFDANYYSMGERALQKKESSFFNLVYRYVLQKKNLHSYDSLVIKNVTLDNKIQEKYLSKIDGYPNLDQPVLNRLGELKSILVFPCITELFGEGKNQALIFKLRKDKCPQTREHISFDEYAMFLSWIVKDYVLQGVKKYKSMIVYFMDSAEEPYICRYFNFSDPTFTQMYSHKLAQARKK